MAELYQLRPLSLRSRDYEALRLDLLVSPLRTHEGPSDVGIDLMNASTASPVEPTILISSPTEAAGGSSTPGFANRGIISAIAAENIRCHSISIEIVSLTRNLLLKRSDVFELRYRTDRTLALVLDVQIKGGMTAALRFVDFTTPPRS